MKQPKFEFGKKVQWKQSPSISFIIKEIALDRDHFIYRDNKDATYYDESGLEYVPKPIQPITGFEFNKIWQSHYGCTWDNSRSHDLYVNLKNFLINKNFIQD